MTQSARAFSDYRPSLRLCVEEEIGGVAYFAAMASFFEGRQRRGLLLLSEIEVATIKAVRSLLSPEELASLDEARLQAEAKAQAKRPASWTALMEKWLHSFAVYITEFENLKKAAPAADLPTLEIFTAHEVASLEFVRLELQGSPQSHAPLEAFLAAYR